MKKYTHFYTYIYIHTYIKEYLKKYKEIRDEGLGSDGVQGVAIGMIKFFTIYEVVKLVRYMDND